MTGDDRSDLEEAQRPVVDFLSSPDAHGGREVEQVTTHISRIFLAGDRAWKLKRAVRKNYLDFSTPDLRKRACRRELELNRDARGLYLGTVPVTRTAEGFEIGGDGPAVDWLVEMRRFDREQEFDRLAARGALGLDDMERLADRIAALHSAAPLAPGFGGPDDLRGRIEQIAGALAEAGGKEDMASAWRNAARAEATRLDGLVRRRARQGRVRRCHGDLHLGNIVMLDGAPTPFDAIEFNEAIGSIDVLYDIALTLMDLLTLGEKALANTLLNRYLGAMGEHSGLALLPLFLSMRGAVRAMVAASRGRAEEARRDMAFAREALARRPAPRLVAVGGLSGSGKSTLGRALAPRLGPLTGAVAIRSDVTRKRLAGAAPETPLPPTGYGERMDRLVRERMARDARRTLRTGFPVLLDATFLVEEGRRRLRRLVEEEGVMFDGLWLDLPTDVAASRAAARRGDASDADAGVVLAQSRVVQPPADWIVIDAAAGLDAVARAACEALSLPAAGFEGLN